MNHFLSNLHSHRQKHLSIYLTAGYPNFNKSLETIKEISKHQVSFIELGMPYSDPLADGETIQRSSHVAIKNGMTMEKYFELLAIIKKETKLPIVFMGYLNQIMQYGIEKFCKKCKHLDIKGLIIPDLPIEIYQKEYNDIFRKHKLSICFLITPTTSTERIRIIEKLTTGFIYIVSNNSITGEKGEVKKEQIEYFNKIKSLNLSKPHFIGFGINNKASFTIACQYADGAIIGSEFIRQLDNNNEKTFLTSILN